MFQSLSQHQLCQVRIELRTHEKKTQIENKKFSLQIMKLQDFVYLHADIH